MQYCTVLFRLSYSPEFLIYIKNACEILVIEAIKKLCWRISIDFGRSCSSVVRPVSNLLEISMNNCSWQTDDLFCWFM